MPPLPEPFSGPPPKEVPLPRAPLIRVLAQIAFPPIYAIQEPPTIAPFQERIRSIYPLVEKNLVQHLDLTDSTPTGVRRDTIWRFFDADRHWRVSLAPAFLALEAGRYTSRRDFVDRLSLLLTALAETLNPQIVLRVGLRYVDRIQDGDFDKLANLVKPDFLAPFRTPFAHAAEHVLTEALLRTAENATIMARWGTLPAGSTTDPDTIEPIGAPSYILDLDMFSIAQRRLDPAALKITVEQFAERIYAVFRFVVTDAFLTNYGGQP